MKLAQFFDRNYLAIIILAVFLYIGYDKLIENIATETAREAINSAIGVIFVIITTMYMLKKQTEIERTKELNNEVFKKKLTLYESSLSLWQGIGFIDEDITQTDVANCLDIQLKLTMVAPTNVTQCATEITTIVTQAYHEDGKRYFSEDEKTTFFQLLSNFAHFVRLDLDLPDTGIQSNSKLIAQMNDIVIAASEIGKKNFDKFEFNGKVYGKGRLVLAVVKKYTQENKTKNAAALTSAFPESWQTKGRASKSLQAKVFFTKEEVVKEQLRAFKDAKDEIELGDGTVVLVNNQWGENIDYFIENVTLAHSYEIKRVRSSH